MTFTAVDLSTLPAPDVIEELSHAAAVQAIRDDVVARFPEIAPVIDLPSEPARKLIEAFAYRETLLRARINDAARAVFLASATGADLDHLAALFGVRRAAGEEDARLRLRLGLAPGALSVAGPEAAYRFHALTAVPDLKDVSAISPAPGAVFVTLLGLEGDGSVSQDHLDAVRAVLDRDDIRPLTDVVSVLAPGIIAYAIDAGLILYPGPTAEPIRQRAIKAAQTYATARHRLGHDITLSGLHAALHIEGVQKVMLRSPADLPLRISDREAAFCTNITVSIDGRNT